MSQEKKENSEDHKEAEAAFERGEFAEFLVDKAFDGLKIDPDYIEKESVFINYGDSPEKMAENIRSMYTPDSPHEGFDKYMALFKNPTLIHPPKKDITNLYLAMNVHIESGKKFGKELDKDIYDSYRKTYHPSIWQRIKKLFN